MNIQTATPAGPAEPDQPPRERSRTLTEIYIAQFCEHKIALVSLVFLFCMATIAVAAPVIVASLGVNPDSQNILHRFAGPGSTIPLSIASQEQRIEAWVEAHPALSERLTRSAVEKGLVSADEHPEDVPYLVNEIRLSDPNAYAEFIQNGSRHLQAFDEVTRELSTRHLLGTDELGRDVLSRLVYGARISLTVAALVGLFSALFGLLVGATAGYFGGVPDNILMRLTDALMTIPALPLYLILAAADLTRIPGLGYLLSGEHQSVIKMVLILSLLTWMPIARIVRGSVLSIRKADYILGARTIGRSHLGIITEHVIPNLFGPLVVAVTLLMGEAILIETGLSFLGLGIQPPTPSWGNMLQNALELVRTMPLQAILPGFLIFLVIIAINFFGDGLRDALDPKSVRR